MATLAITVPAGSVKGGAGEVIRAFARQLDALAMSIPDLTPTGASTVLTIDNAPTGAIVSAQVTAGPYQTGVFIA